MKKTYLLLPFYIVPFFIPTMEGQFMYGLNDLKDRNGIKKMTVGKIVFKEGMADTTAEKNIYFYSSTNRLDSLKRFKNNGGYSIEKITYSDTLQKSIISNYENNGKLYLKQTIVKNVFSDKKVFTKSESDFGGFTLTNVQLYNRFGKEKCLKNYKDGVLTRVAKYIYELDTLKIKFLSFNFNETGISDIKNNGEWECFDDEGLDYEVVNFYENEIINDTVITRHYRDNELESITKIYKNDLEKRYYGLILNHGKPYKEFWERYTDSLSFVLEKWYEQVDEKKIVAKSTERTKNSLKTVLKTQYFYPDEKMELKEIFTVFKYDNNGNWIEKTESTNDETVVKYFRKIEYFN